MDAEEFKSEILELLKRSRMRLAAEKLLAVSKTDKFQYRTIEVCLQRIEKLERDEAHYKANGQFMEGAVLSHNRTSWGKIANALIEIAYKLSPEELESN